MNITTAIYLKRMAKLILETVTTMLLAMVILMKMEMLKLLLVDALHLVLLADPLLVKLVIGKEKLEEIGDLLKPKILVSNITTNFIE